MIAVRVHQFGKALPHGVSATLAKKYDLCHSCALSHICKAASLGNPDVMSVVLLGESHLFRTQKDVAGWQNSQH